MSNNKIMVIVSKTIVPKGFGAITLFPFIFVREEWQANDKRTINHEQIHLCQQLELLIVFFYLWYGVEWLIRYIDCGDSKEAYYAISFECEAYANQRDLEYLKKRRWFSFLKYL